MKTFLLKQMEQISKSAVAKLTISSFKSLRLLYAGLTVVIVATASVAYAEQPLSDVELDSKYIEVKIIPVCTTDKLPKSGKQECHDANSFVAVVNNQQLGTTDSKSQTVVNSDVLLSGVLDNMRLLGGSDILGVPAGVANTGIPLLFGNENYSDAWAGNLNQIFQPSATASQINAPYSVYDTSSLGYGFHEEAHFPQNLPQPTIQAFTTH